MRLVGMMILLGAIALLSACSSSHKSMKVNYEVLQDKGHKMLVGVINRGLITNDTAFGWFNENSKYGQPDAIAVSVFQLEKSKFKMVVFGGTWCEDTQNLLPKFYQLVDASGYPENQITLIAVDRQKQTINKLNTVYSITNVPTFIVLKEGKEVGRVVEYGTEGDITKELGKIVSGIK